MSKDKRYNRQISKQQVNTFYQSDPTIQFMEFNIPFHLKLLKDQTQIEEKIDKIFQTIIKSTSKPVSFSDEEMFLLTLLLRSIGYQEKDKNGSFEFTKFIGTIKEAISLLSTSFHLEAVKFLSEHLFIFLKSSMFSKIEEEIIFDIIVFFLFITTKGEINQTKPKIINKYSMFSKTITNHFF